MSTARDHTAMGKRLFSDEELETLASAPPDERSERGAITGYADWIAHTQAWLLESHGLPALSVLNRVTRTFFATVAPMSSEHDTYRDWISVVLAHVYETYGVDDLEAALAHAAERTLLAWMPNDIARPPEKRLMSWVRLLRGHHSELRIEEEDDRFVITQDPCGSCTRQVDDGRYGSPLSLPVVEEWGGPTIYRSHVRVMHQALPRQRIGVPWPVNICPAGLGTGPCTILLYKDPLDPAAADVPTPFWPADAGDPE
jgi:hypothetical protein